MEVIFDRCCGIDVHKKTLTACIMVGEGDRVGKKEIRTYSSMTEDIEQLRDWLKSEGITHVAMESTGVYWKPMYNILEEDFEILLANARHVKNVPGRKTDVKDSEWLCKLLRNRLIEGSFIPPRHIRQMRDMTRHRAKLNNTIASEKNRLQKYLEDANIKLSSVATDIFGASGNNESAGKKKRQDQTRQQMDKGDTDTVRAWGIKNQRGIFEEQIPETQIETWGKKGGYRHRAQDTCERLLHLE